MAGSRMEVDPPASYTLTPTTATPTLKRSNSAPMINILGLTSSVPSVTVTCSITTISSTVTQPGPSQYNFRPTEVPRTRRYSTSCTGLHSPTAPHRKQARILQIKQEACANVVNREVQHEREIQSSIQMSQSCEELSLEEHMMTAEVKRPRSFSEQLHIFTPPYSYASSPSPTRVGKQCYSPSLQQPVRGDTLTPSPSPSPTRKVFRTSLSPITMRPSPLGMKRKMDLDGTDRFESYASPSKRLARCSTPERLPMIPHPLVHSISSSAVEVASSSGPLQSMLGLPATVATTRVVPTHCFSFRPVQERNDSSGTHSGSGDTNDSEHTAMATDAMEHTSHESISDDQT